MRFLPQLAPASGALKPRLAAWSPVCRSGSTLAIGACLAALAGCGGAHGGHPAAAAARVSATARGATGAQPTAPGFPSASRGQPPAHIDVYAAAGADILSPV